MKRITAPLDRRKETDFDGDSEGDGEFVDLEADPHAEPVNDAAAKTGLTIEEEREKNAMTERILGIEVVRECQDVRESCSVPEDGFCRG